jgi:xylulokinase
MYLGIDLGTSEVKALVLDENNGIVATHSAPLTIQRPNPHWSEQSPEAWWEATEYLIATLREKCGHHWQAIKAIGLSGQMHGAVLLDATGKTLRPAILWNDTRSAQECAELEEMAPELHQVAGNLAMPGFTAPKLLWVRRHEPQNFSRIATVLLPKDYLRFKMTGKKISDMSDSAGTLWLDVEKRDWSDALLEKCGLSRAAMPALVEGCEVSAVLEPAVAQRWGLNPSVVVAGGGGDNAVSAIGVGAVSPGDAFISLGTSGVLFVVTDTYRPAPQSAVHAFCHVLPNLWHQMSVMLSAASCLQWFCRLVGVTELELLLMLFLLTRRPAKPSPAGRGQPLPTSRPLLRRPMRAIATGATCRWPNALSACAILARRCVSAARRWRKPSSARWVSPLPRPALKWRNPPASATGMPSTARRCSAPKPPRWKKRLSSTVRWGRFWR